MNLSTSSVEAFWDELEKISQTRSQRLLRSSWQKSRRPRRIATPEQRAEWAKEQVNQPSLSIQKSMDEARRRRARGILGGVEKTADKLSKHIMTASGEELRKTVNRIIGSAGPTQMKSSELGGAVRELRSEGDLSPQRREDLLRALRVRMRSGFYGGPRGDRYLDPYRSKGGRKNLRLDLEFARTFKERVKSPLITLEHGGVKEELEQILKHGPNAAVGYSSTASGKKSRAGLFFHEAGHARMPFYARRAGQMRGGEGAVLRIKVPRDLLSVQHTGGGAEYMLPRSLWKYVQSAEIEKVSAVESDRKRRLRRFAQGAAGGALGLGVGYAGTRYALPKILKELGAKKASPRAMRLLMLLSGLTGAGTLFALGAHTNAPPSRTARGIRPVGAVKSKNRKLAVGHKGHPSQVPAGPVLRPRERVLPLGARRRTIRERRGGVGADSDRRGGGEYRYRGKAPRHRGFPWPVRVRKHEP